MPYDFYTDGQQLTAADDAPTRSEDCGLADGYLRDEEFENVRPSSATTSTNGHNGVQPAESAFKVDGENAYFSYNADQINEEANGFPQLAYGYSQDPANGNLTISDEEPAAICPDPTYPPNAGTCEEFLPSVVRVVSENRTDPRRPPGPDHRQPRKHRRQIPCCRSAAGERTGLQPPRQIDRKEFPGESGYVPRVEGETVSFPDTGTNAVYIKVTGSADGDIETGRVAIVFFQPSSPAIFNSFADVEQLLLRQRGDGAGDRDRDDQIRLRPGLQPGRSGSTGG